MAKILLVEDDNNLREIYEARLQAEGFSIVSAHDGEEALVVAKNERPDLIISDVMMPKISGFEMLDIIRATPTLANVKIIMLTALGQNEDQDRANKLGADRYLVKSQVTLEDIVNTANELLSQSSAPSLDQLNSSTEMPPTDQLTDVVPPIVTSSVMPESTPEAVAPSPEPSVSQPVMVQPVEPPAQTSTMPDAMSLSGMGVGSESSTEMPPTDQSSSSAIQSNQDLIDQAVKEINQASSAATEEDNGPNLPPSMNNPLGGQRIIQPLSNSNEPKLDISSINTSSPSTQNPNDDFDPNTVAL